MRFSFVRFFCSFVRFFSLVRKIFKKVASLRLFWSKNHQNRSYPRYFSAVQRFSGFLFFVGRPFKKGEAHQRCGVGSGVRTSGWTSGWTSGRAFGRTSGRRAYRQRRRKKKIDRGGPVWPPRSNVTNDRFRGGSGGPLPPQPKTGGSRGQRPPAKIFRKNEKNRKIFDFFPRYLPHGILLFSLTFLVCQQPLQNSR